MKRSTLALLCLALVPAGVAGQQRPLPLKHAPRLTSGAISPADLMTRLYIFADDSMMGRSAGTVYHDKGVDYIARELTRIGVTPAGENGTFFQRIPLMKRTLAEGTTLTVDGRTFSAGRDFLPRDTRDFGLPARAMDGAPIVYGGVFGDTAKMISPADASGKVVLFSVPRGWQANRGGLTERYIGAYGIAVATLDSMPPDVRSELSQPSTGMSGSARTSPLLPSFFYASAAMADAMLGGSLASLSRGAPGKTITGTFEYRESPAPGSRNVIGLVPGGDPKLRGQYVAIGAHSDHVGFASPVDHDSLYAFYHVVRPRGADDGDKPATAEDLPKVKSVLDSLRKERTARNDSIYNGADDDGSGSMALLEIAEAFMAGERPKRSLLLVWHVAEEGGLLGADYFTENPTVPRDSIVAQINLDMIGRGSATDTPGGGPGYLQLIGARRLSTQLGDIVEAEGKKASPAFNFDYQYDANGHPQQFYCRSDHYMYARYGIPVVFMSTGGHPEYHQVTDEPQYIDYDQLARVTRLVFNTATTIGNLDQRLAVNGPKPDPKGECRQ